MLILINSKICAEWANETWVTWPIGRESTIFNERK